jgi:hypothetical protein
LLLAVLIALGAWWAREAHISSTLPYPRHVDEPAITERAAHILAQNDYDPGWFHWPTLSIYTTAVGMGFGFLQEAKDGNVVDAAAIGSVGMPYYEHPRIVGTARSLFAGLSVVGLLAIGFVGRKLSGRPGLLPLTMAVLAVSSFYFYMSWAYLSADLVGAATAALALLAATHALEEEHWSRRGLLPGLLVGIATSAKYNNCVLLIAALLAVALGRKAEGKGESVVAAVLGTVVGFLLGTPYAVWNVRRFVSDVGFDMHHYSTGHAGYEFATGWPQFFGYLEALVASFGWLTLALALLGLGYALRTNWRATVVVGSFPVLLLLFLCQYTVRFERNILGIHGVYALFVAMGIVAIPAIAHARDWVAKLTARGLPQRGAVAGLWTAYCVFLLIAFDWSGLDDQLNVEGDSRVLAADWMREELPEDAVVLVPTELGFHPDALAKIGTVPVDVRAMAGAEELARVVADHRATHMVWPVWGRDERFKARRFGKYKRMRPSGKRLVRFGSNKVLVNYSLGTVPGGDPKIAVVELISESVSGEGSQSPSLLNPDALLRPATSEGAARGTRRKQD